MSQMSDRSLEEIAYEYHPEVDFDRYMIRYGGRLIAERARDGSALELGCAEGFMTELILDCFERIVAVDGSSRYVEDARRRVVSEKVEFHTCLFEDFETEERFDNITMTRVLEHVADPVALLRRASGWLAGSGVIHIIVPNATALNRRIGKEMGLISDLHELHERDRRIGHKRVYDFEHLRGHVEAADLKVVHEEGILLKPLSNAQMLDWNEEIIKALFAVGRELPDYCSEIYFLCTK